MSRLDACSTYRDAPCTTASARADCERSARLEGRSEYSSNRSTATAFSRKPSPPPRRRQPLTSDRSVPDPPTFTKGPSNGRHTTENSIHTSTDGMRRARLQRGAARAHESGHPTRRGSPTEPGHSIRGGRPTQRGRPTEPGPSDRIDPRRTESGHSTRRGRPTKPSDRIRAIRPDEDSPLTARPNRASRGRGEDAARGRLRGPIRGSAVKPTESGHSTRRGRATKPSRQTKRCIVTALSGTAVCPCLLGS